jgi:hypothetical protein
MKTKKWITYTFVTLFTLVALAAVGFAGFRVGVMQSASFAKGMLPFNDHMRGFDENNKDQGNEPNNQGNQGQGPNKPQDFGNSKDSGNHKGFDNQRGFERGRGFGHGGGFFGPLFGLIRLIVLGVLLWLGYRFVKNSGWRLVNVNAATTTAAPTVSESVPDENGDEEKDQT